MSVHKRTTYTLTIVKTKVANAGFLDLFASQEREGYI